MADNIYTTGPLLMVVIITMLITIAAVMAVLIAVLLFSMRSTGIHTSRKRRYYWQWPLWLQTYYIWIPCIAALVSLFVLLYND